jgi:hypothetical protein
VNPATFAKEKRLGFASCVNVDVNSQSETKLVVEKGKEEHVFESRTRHPHVLDTVKVVVGMDLHYVGKVRLRSPPGETVRRSVAVCSQLGLFAVSAVSAASAASAASAVSAVSWPFRGDSVDVFELHMLDVEGDPLETKWSFTGTDACKFHFFCSARGFSGRMAFTTAPQAQLLLVADLSNAAVHVLDPVSGEHKGFVATPGVLQNPRSIAAHDCLVAVGICDNGHCDGEAVDFVQLFKVRGRAGGCPLVWSPLRKINVGSAFPVALRWCRGGSQLAVGDTVLGCQMFFNPDNGDLVGFTVLGGRVCAFVEDSAGWVVLDGFNASLGYFIDGLPSGHSESCADRLSSMDVIPGVGILAAGKDVHMFVTSDVKAMARMSVVRTAWMVAVAKAALARGSLPACVAN